MTAAVEPDATELGEVIVTGSLLGSSGELASPVVMLDRDELDRRGFATVAEALTDLPQNYSGSGTPAALLSYADPAGSNSVASTGVNLRGLGADATLVLVNGAVWRGPDRGVSLSMCPPCRRRRWSGSMSCWTAPPPSMARTRWRGWSMSSCADRWTVRKAVCASEPRMVGRRT